MRRLNDKEIKEMRDSLDFTLDETKEIAEIFYTEKEKGNFILKNTNLNSVDDYIKEYENYWYRYSTWERLLESEEDQNEGLTPEECEGLKNIAIFQLSSGMWIQSVY